MSSSFGNLVKKHLAQKPDFNQRALADKIGITESGLSRILSGERLLNLDARKRVLDIITALHEAEALDYIEEANELLEVAGWARLRDDRKDDKELLQKLKHQPISGEYQSSHQVKKGTRIWMVLGSLVLLVAVSSIAINFSQRQSLFPLVCAYQQITCIGNGWCRTMPAEVSVVEGNYQVLFDREANLNREHYPYFNGAYMDGEVIQLNQFNPERSQWQFIVDEQWINNNPDWKDTTLWYLDFKCDK